MLGKCWFFISLNIFPKSGITLMQSKATDCYCASVMKNWGSMMLTRVCFQDNDMFHV